jgi:hypothetical protein
MNWTTIGTIIAIILTVMVYSYLVGDSFIFRLAEHILVGVSVGWIFLQVLFSVLLPAFNSLQREVTGGSLSTGTLLAYLVPIILGVILLFRPLRAAKPLTNLVMALVVGTVAALSLAGAVTGTIIPQVGATVIDLRKQTDIGALVGTILMILGTLLALWYFNFTVRKPQNGQTAVRTNSFAAISQLLGRWSLMLAFGAVFGMVFLTYFAALVDRILFLLRPGL